MLPKPPSCIQCPMAGNMKGFVPDEWVHGSKVVVLGQNPGHEEELQGKPKVGATGQLEDTHFIPLAGLQRGVDVSVANVLKCRWEVGGKKVNTLPPSAILAKAVEHCTREHLRIPDHVTHIVAEGGLALQYTMGETLPMTLWRGCTPPKHNMLGKAVYFVEHIASLLHNPKAWWISELDWRKVGTWLAGEWPLPVPLYIDCTEDTWLQCESWLTRQWPYVAIDTEWLGKGTVHEPGYLTLLGIGAVDTDGNISGIQIDWAMASPLIRERFGHYLRTILKGIPVVLQNFAADMPILKKYCGIEYDQYKRVDDTMLAHAILYCELPHTLEFLASIYGKYVKLKHLQRTNPRLYNWGDVLETISAWEGIKMGLASDILAARVYEDQSLQLIPIVLESMECGIAVNAAKVLELKPEYEAKVQQATAMAQAYAGWAINLGSDEQIKYYTYTERGLPVQSDPDTGRPTVGQDALAVLRDIVGPPVDPMADLTIELAIARLEGGADPILEARALYQKYQHILDAYIYPLHRRVAAAESEAEAKTIRAATRGLVWQANDVATRIYPSFVIHAQKTGRWSTKDPPLAQLPKGLRDIICPDPGYVWFHWDWQGIELQLLEAHSGSDILRQAHNDGIDLHTWRTCMMFGYELPPNLINPHTTPECEQWRNRYKWLGRDDPRRVFAKQGTYEMIYGGYGLTAAEKAVRMGLNRQVVKQALQRLLTADDKYYKWRLAVEEQVRSTRILRTFMGRPRRFLGTSRGSAKVSPKVVREALDYKMQGGVSDVFNTTAIAIKRSCADATLAWSMHDSQYYSIPIEKATDELLDKLKSIVTAEYIIGGVTKRFPATFGLIYPQGAAA